uniref:Uncharacterized protein n=2 Tax=Escherichia coli TaxID=562 RepID=A0A4P8G9C9_ECOLX|nr:hypothetical protein [Escherichia coli J53]QCO89590.1 hypothetical protein [Escherichia coli]WOL87107.1 hypothetical protein DIHLIJNC_00044 [Citrobacter freundii]WOL88136.1 hypothetical protein MIBNNLFC_00044 [Citrobacter freundii]WOL89505.1 hypothetical protein PFECCAOI_00049 [Escherichia coli]
MVDIPDSGQHLGLVEVCRIGMPTALEGGASEFGI